MARGRAFRRRQARLAKRRARAFLRRWYWGPATARPPPPAPALRAARAQVGLFASTHCKPCSCAWGCGHVRLVEGPTRQELKAELSAREQLRECSFQGGQ